MDRRATPLRDPNEEGVRLQKVLAAAGVGSRRACEELIDRGRVSVDGHKVKNQGMRVDPAKAVIHVDGLRINSIPNTVHIALNKPIGMLSTMTDPEGRANIGELVEDRGQRLFHVGRLDAETEGLILLMNDGELAHRLTHPSYGVQKTYLAQVDGIIPKDLGKRLKEGILLEDGLARIDNFRMIDAVGKHALVEVTLHEGRKHIVRRLLDEVGFPVKRLVRTQFGPIALGDQRPGKIRNLNMNEVGALYKAVDL
jgi:23S rRNA pseudouridine2605 synthase